MHMRLKLFPTLTLPLLLWSCGVSTTADGAFLSQLSQYCGEAYRGEIVTTDSADDGWRQERIVMHVRDCTDNEIKIALHVGEDRSRTWILRYEDEQLALRHDHRHKDGQPDDVTFYGGFAKTITPTRITFPADQSTKEIFDRADISVSNANIWAVGLDRPNKIFTYEMTRPNRNFRIEFDTSKAVETPPVPWGWE